MCACLRVFAEGNGRGGWRVRGTGAGTAPGRVSNECPCACASVSQDKLETAHKTRKTEEAAILSSLRGAMGMVCVRFLVFAGYLCGVGGGGGGLGGVGGVGGGRGSVNVPGSWFHLPARYAVGLVVTCRSNRPSPPPPPPHVQASPLHRSMSTAALEAPSMDIDAAM